MNAKILALIPARSGSQALPHKNIKKLDNIPLLVHAIRLAKASTRRKEKWTTVVSTDSKYYARLARHAGADVPFLRPKHLATACSPLILTVLHALRELGKLNYQPDSVILLSATTPLTEARDVRRAFKLHCQQKVSVVSVVRDPIPQNWRFQIKGNKLWSSDQRKIQQRQFSTPMYYLNGAIYIATPSWLVKHRQFVVSQQTVAFTMPRNRSLDIEDKIDFSLAQFLWFQKSKALLGKDV